MITNSPALLRAIVPHLCCVLVVGVFGSANAAGGTTNAPAKPAELAKSTFTMPRNKAEGRDPFHPNSDYPYQLAGAKSGSKGPVSTAPADLKLKGIGGTPANPIVTINDRSFGKGEDGEMTVGGSKVQIHIVEILEDSVIITVNGEQRELRFRRSFQ